MTAHPLVHEDDRRSALRPAFAHGPFRLGWADFWLIAGVLGGILALVGMVFVLYLRG